MPLSENNILFYWTAPAQLLLLMKWRSFRRSLQAFFHASMKSAYGNPRVNCVLHFIQGFANFALSQMGKML